MTILFRSHKCANFLQQNRRSKRGTTSDEWSDLREYSPENDAKDIVWKRSTEPNTIISKKRELQQSLRLIFCAHRDIGDDFMTAKDEISRSEWKKQSLDILKKSAQKSNFPFQEFFEKKEQNLETLVKNKIKNHLIIFLTSSLDFNEKSYKVLSRQNDVIIVYIEHIFEKNPDTSVWIEGKVFDTKKIKKYQDERQKIQKEFIKKCKKNKISPLFLDTTQSIETALNHFFKYRYARKK